MSINKKIIFSNYINSRGSLYQESNIANKDYWKLLWQTYSDEQIKNLGISSRNKDDIIVQVSKKYLQKHAKLIEAGCGLGHEVVKLESSGFHVTGIDSDENLIRRLNKIYPKNKFFKANVLNLENLNDLFDGYWSFGVMEHFITEYEEIIKQAYKVLNKDGYCFIVIPTLNKLSMLKKKLNIYKRKEISNDYFHQYFFSIDEIKNLFRDHGFQFKESFNMSGSVGACRELSIPKILKNRSKLRLIRGIWWMLDPILKNFSWHTTLFVFKKVSQI